MAEHNEIGKIGEKIAQTFLVKHGFSLVITNFRTKYGEIDIIAEKDGKLRFVEVKSVKVKDFSNLDRLAVRPEDNLTGDKWSKLIISIEMYLKSRSTPLETRWQVDLACVYVNTEAQQGKVLLLENIHKE